MRTWVAWEVFTGCGFGSAGLWVLTLGLHWWLPAFPRPPLWVCGVVVSGVVMTIVGVAHAVRTDWQAR